MDKFVKGEVPAPLEADARGMLHMDIGPRPEGAMRPLHCQLTPEEFGMIRWAANRTLDDQKKVIPLQDFYRHALFCQLREVVKLQVQRGKIIPPNIAQFVGEYFRGK